MVGGSFLRNLASENHSRGSGKQSVAKSSGGCSLHYPCFFARAGSLVHRVEGFGGGGGGGGVKARKWRPF